MKRWIRMSSLLLVVCVLTGAAQTADAQIWKRATEKLQDKLERKAEEELAQAAAETVEEAIAEEAANGAAQGNRQSGASSSNASRNTSSGNAADAAAGTALLGALTGGGSNTAAGEPVDFRELKALLPENLPGLSRTEATGQKSSALGFKSSSAEAEYGTEDGSRSVHLTITDMGSMSSWAMLGHAWMNTEIDSETDTGYERTLKFRGYPAHERFDDQDGYRSGEFTVIVGQRFVITFNGNDVDMDVLKAGAEKIDYAKLEALKAKSEAEAQPVLADFRALKALLPERAGGLSRTSHTGQQSNALGMQTATAEANYEQGDRRVRVTITDLGGMSGLGMLGYAWFSTQIDSESDRGFERTLRFKDHPAYQKYEHNGNYRHASFQVAVAKRFVVEAQGDNVEMADLEAVLGNIDLTQLAAMAPAQ